MTEPIITKRLILRSFEERDRDDLYEYLSDFEVVDFEPYKPLDEYEVLQELDYRVQSDEMIAVEERDSGKLIGNLYFAKRDCLDCELGFVFNKDYWGCGFAFESCEAIIKKALDDGVHRIYAECDPLNERSWKLLERLGFVREAHFKSNVYFWADDDGYPIWKDTYVYSLLNEKRVRLPEDLL